MVSYLKTQWFRFLLGCIFTVIALVYLFQPASELGTLEGLEQDLRNEIHCVTWFVSALIWFITSMLDWNSENNKAAEKRISELEERVKLLETRAITEIDQISKNHFMIRRRLGPDKDVPYPEEAKDEIL